MTINAPIESPLVRCAIYTRKSTTNGLERDVNSLETQRQVCQSYIKCQAHRNWVELPRQYDDGGYSGATLRRPALKRLIGDVETGRIDVVVIYKVDRLSRSLPDFVRLMDIFSTYGVSFVSVTQTFDTSDSMGRLVLNILLTFAQFERELMGDRVRDKRAALARHGYYMGGMPPFGYCLGEGRKLVLDPERVDIIREVYRRFPDEPAQRIAKDLRARGVTTPTYISSRRKKHGGTPICTNHVLNILRNPIYTGHIVHRGEWIRAKFEPLIDREHWELIQELKRLRFPQPHDPIENFLLGILHDEVGRRMKIQRGSGRSRALRYYKSEHASWAVGTTHRRVMVDASRTEQLTVSTLQAFLTDRAKLREAVLSLGLYSDETARLLRRGGIAARRVALMDKTHLRELLLALVPRADVNTFELRLLVSCYELKRFLAWDGVGLFQKSQIRPLKGGDRFRFVHAPAFLVCGHPYFALPIKPRLAGEASPDQELVGLLVKAGEFREFMLANRTKSVGELARAKGVGQGTFARLLRLNYLAPDIQTAIMDGTQPAGLTSFKIVYGPLPLDWETQRQLMGFGVAAP